MKTKIKMLGMVTAMLLNVASANAGTITIQVVEGGQTNATKTFTILDADIDRLVAAYQSLANVSINGTATRAQVLNYVVTQWMQSGVATVTAFEAAKAITALVPATPINPQ